MTGCYLHAWERNGSSNGLPHKKSVPTQSGQLHAAITACYFSFFLGALFFGASFGAASVSFTAATGFTAIRLADLAFLLLPKEPMVIFPRLVLLSPLPMNYLFFSE